MKNPLAEARRWWDQAVDDLAFVRWIGEEGRFFGKGCFVAPQAAEKALKACRYARGERFVPGHSRPRPMCADTSLLADIWQHGRRGLGYGAWQVPGHLFP